jgi:predicted nucleotidyltransferase
MRSEAPPLLPILRSRAQAGLLTIVLLNPDDELTMTELAGRIEAPLSSVSDEVARLERAGILSTRLVGRARLVRAASGPLVEPLTMLVLRAFGPIQVIAEEFADLADVERVLLFGSWAARYRGQEGPDPNDIDVLVVHPTALTPDRESIYEAARRAERRLLRPVNPTVVSCERWEAKADPLLEEIASRPIVRVLPAVESGKATVSEGRH